MQIYYLFVCPLCYSFPTDIGLDFAYTQFIKVLKYAVLNSQYQVSLSREKSSDKHEVMHFMFQPPFVLE